MDLSELSTIEPGDRDLYRGLFAQDWALGSYGNCWTYVTQACRQLGLGHKYLDGSTLVSIGRHGDSYVLTRPVGPRAVRAAAELAHELARGTGAPVYLKHVGHPDAEELTRRHGFLPMDRHPWTPGAPLDDATYPDVLVDTAELTEPGLRAPGRSKLRMRLNRFRNSCGLTGVRVRLYRPPGDDEWKQIAREIAVAWSAGRGHDANDSNAYTNMIDHPADGVHVYLVDVDEHPCGFYLFEGIGPGTVACYANLCLDATRPGLTETALCTVLADLHRRGITTVNLGGSEHRTLHTYKLKFGSPRTSSTVNLVSPASGQRTDRRELGRRLGRGHTESGSA
jgi:hypothetical protein